MRIRANILLGNNGEGEKRARRGGWGNKKFVIESSFGEHIV